MTVDSIYRFRDGEWSTLDLGTMAPKDMTEAYDIKTVGANDAFVVTQHGVYVYIQNGLSWTWPVQNSICYTNELLPSRGFLIETATQGAFLSDDKAESLSLPEDGGVQLDDDGTR